jgi:uncharacterized membrane protein
MNKAEFIDLLDKSLKGITYEEKREIIYDYEEHFSVGLEQGKTEDEIAKDLGDPKTIAKQFRNNYMIVKAENNKSAGNLVSAIFASVGLGFLNLVILPVLFAAVCVVFSLLLAGASVILALVISAGAVIISFCSASIAMAISGIGVILGVIVQPLFPEFISIDINLGTAVFLAIGVFCLGILSGIGSLKLSKIIYKYTRQGVIYSYNGSKKFVRDFYMWILKYLKMNLSIISIRKENEDA